MPYPTTGSNTELQAVNQILASVGQAPVNSLTTEETFVLEKTDSFVGSISGTTLNTTKSDITVGTFISGTGVTQNTSIAQAGVAKGTVLTTSSLSGGSGYTAGTAVATTGGNGTGLTVDTTVTAGAVTAITINAAGSDYQVGDVITITGGNANATFTVASLDNISYDYTVNISQTVASTTINQSVVSFKVETQTNPDVAIAYNTLTEVSREVQSEGWSFNRERNYTQLQPDSSTKKIAIPNNAIQVDLSQDYQINLGRNAVNRGGYLYDTIGHTDVWDTGETIYLDMVWEWEYEYLPQPVQAYIVARAAAVFCSRTIGDPNQYQMLQQKEAYARAMALEYECNQNDVTIFGSPKDGNYYSSYNPFNALIR